MSVLGSELRRPLHHCHCHSVPRKVTTQRGTSPTSAFCLVSHHQTESLLVVINPLCQLLILVLGSHLIFLDSIIRFLDDLAVIIPSSLSPSISSGSLVHRRQHQHQPQQQPLTRRPTTYHVIIWTHVSRAEPRRWMKSWAMTCPSQPRGFLTD